MTTLAQTLLAFALILGSMIIIHEIGHFLVARVFGIRVTVFSVGFGKRLWGFKRGHTDYRISLIPLGGYVSMAGEGADAVGAPDEFSSKPRWQRICVAAAGPGVNILAALAIPALLSMYSHHSPAYWGEPARVGRVEADSPAERSGVAVGDLITEIDGIHNPTWLEVEDRVLIHADHTVTLTVRRGDAAHHLTLDVGKDPYHTGQAGYSGMLPDLGVGARTEVTGVVKGSPADIAGLRAGDHLLSIGDREISPTAYGKNDISGALRASAGKPVRITLLRDGEHLSLDATPEMVDGEWRIGVRSSLRGIPMSETHLGPVAALKHSISVNWRVLRLTAKAFGQVIDGTRSPSDTFSGPIGIAKVSGDAAERGAGAVLGLMGLLSLNLGVFNLLPIPMLDGGVIFMLGFESLLERFGLRLAARLRERIMSVGFAFLMTLMILVLVNDIVRLIAG